MTPKQFKEVNVTFGKNQPEYQLLPAFKNNTTGEVVTCWSLSFRERFRILFTGEIWLCLLTFGKPPAPTFLTTEKSEVFSDSDGF